MAKARPDKEFLRARTPIFLCDFDGTKSGIPYFVVEAKPYGQGIPSCGTSAEAKSRFLGLRLRQDQDSWVLRLR